MSSNPCFDLRFCFEERFAAPENYGVASAAEIICYKLAEQINECLGLILDNSQTTWTRFDLHMFSGNDELSKNEAENGETLFV